MNAPELNAMTDCPELEDLAAFHEGRLPEADRARILEHVASCGMCQDILVGLDEYEMEETAKVVRGKFGEKVWVPAAAVAAIVVIVTSTFLRDRSGMEVVVKASNSLQYRPSTARLSGDFPYRQVAPIYRSAEADEKLDLSFARLWSVIADIRENAGDNPSPSQLHALGASLLLTQKPAEAVVALEDALKRETGEPDTIKAIGRSANAALLNDLAVSYQTLIERKRALEFQPAAIEAVQRSWSLQKTPQIAWTRAVVIESLHIRENAIRAWNDYLELDPSSEWSEEARRRLKRLQQPTEADLWPATREQLSRSLGSENELRTAVNRFRQQVRLWCEEELLPAWGKAVLANDPLAPEHLAKVSALGQALTKVNGEQDVLDAVQAIRSADELSVRQLARGHIAYGAGRAAIVSPNGATAVHEMNVAVAALTPSLTPFSWRARAEHAAAVYTAEKYGQALDELKELSRQVKTPSQVLIGRIHWISGIASLRSSSPKQAVDHYLLALAAFNAAGEANLQAALHCRLSAAYRELGDHEKVRKHEHAALQLLAVSGDTRRRHEVIFESAYTAMRNDHPALADLLLDAVVDHDRATGNAVTACTSLTWRGTFRLRRGLTEPAATDLRDARAFCFSIADLNVRERAIANLGLAQAMISAPVVTQQQLAELNGAIDYYEKTESRDWLRTAYLVRARSLANQGNVQAAERDFQVAVAAMMATRKEIAEQGSRLAFTATADETADFYIEFLLQQQRERDAFELADRSRARELIDSPTARWELNSANSSLAAIQSSLPPGTAILEYRVLGRRVVAWIIGSKTFRVVTLTATYTDITRTLEQVDPRAPEPRFREISAVLYDALIAPLQPSLAPFRTIVVIPDAALERVPYSALYDRASGHYVAQTWVTFMDFSALLFVQSVGRFADRSRGSDAIVVVDAASPGSDTDALPNASLEAEAVAAIYPSAQLLNAAGTTNSATVLSAAEEATMLHFAGHGLGVGDDAENALRLDDGARIIPADLLASSMSRMRIAYLSACATDTGPILKAEGSATIARSFFAAGVPVIVATLWPVEDSTARSIARVFYERFRAGAPPADALRDAQLSVLSHSTGSRADWAAFRVIGAGIPFEKRST